MIEVEEMEIETKGEFGGLGIEIGIRDGVLTVIAPLDGTPAAGVTIDYVGPMRGTRVTDANGAYMFGGVNGLYMVSARTSPPPRRRMCIRMRWRGWSVGSIGCGPSGHEVGSVERPLWTRRQGIAALQFPRKQAM